MEILKGAGRSLGVRDIVLEMPKRPRNFSSAQCPAVKLICSS